MIDTFMQLSKKIGLKQEKDLKVKDTKKSKQKQGKSEDKPQKERVNKAMTKDLNSSKNLIGKRIRLT